MRKHLEIPNFQLKAPLGQPLNQEDENVHCAVVCISFAQGRRSLANLLMKRCYLLKRQIILRIKPKKLLLFILPKKV